MAKVRFGNRVANQVTPEQLREAWSRGVELMERSLKREAKIVEQEEWLQRNSSHPDFSRYLTKVTVNRDVWYVDYLDPFYQAAAAYGRLCARLGEEGDAMTRDIHEYGALGAEGLHRLHAETARDRGLPGGSERVTDAELPF